MSLPATNLRPLEVAEEVGAQLSIRDRGAYFTPREIARFLADWAIADRPQATVLDPTCGDGSFLEAAARQLDLLGGSSGGGQLIGVDIDASSLESAHTRLAQFQARARLRLRDFLTMSSPDGLLGEETKVDAVVGNPPYVRFQKFSGSSRSAGRAAATQHGVRLSGLASSWAPILIHAASFLRDDGRLAMVLPAELMTVGYAEPVRKWLLERFGGVKLVLFERLQFADAQEDVVLLLAHGTGGCDAFSLYYVETASDLERIRRFDEHAVSVPRDGKWSSLLLPLSQRQLFQQIARESFSELRTFGRLELGTVTGNNDFFTLSESVRAEFDLRPRVEVHPVVPPATRFRGVQFSNRDWELLRDSGARVWLLAPPIAEPSAGLGLYLKRGEELGVPDTYKCRTRALWWRPPMVQPPDLLFTYMSHRFPRMIANRAKATVLNSMHGIRVAEDQPKWILDILPLAMFNSLTILGGEILGRPYGGGVLKMEPREAARLPLPKLEILRNLSRELRDDRSTMLRQLRSGVWTTVIARVDKALFVKILGLPPRDASELHEAARALRTRRLTRNQDDPIAVA